MNFISTCFFAFIAIFVAVYYCTPASHRYIPLLAGSVVFYRWNDWHYLPILIGVISISYIGGRALSCYRWRLVYAIFFLVEIGMLFFFKYTNFFISNWNAVTGDSFSDLDIILPVGLSFYVFQSISYLSDIYRKGFVAEKNILRYAAYVSFFPTILSGPIQKSRKLLPQIQNPQFNSEQAIKGLILFVWGAFVKVCVANRLLMIVGKVFTADTYLTYGTAYYIVAAVSFSLYIYSDFSSYSDMAQGISKILGIDIGRNFSNPYLSTSLSEFWRRWHSSLNDWLIENIYIPLGGSHKGRIRKYFNVMLVFLASGLWHGAAWHFMIWGAVNGLLVIAGQILCPIKTRFYRHIRVDEHGVTMVLIRRIVVFGLITLTWVFFQNGVAESVYIIRRMLVCRPSELFVPDLWNISGSVTQTVLTIMFAIFFSIVQCKRYDEKQAISYQIFMEKPMILQWVLLGLLIAVTAFAGFSGTSTVGSRFLYFNF